MSDEQVGAEPIGPWAEAATFADADFAFTIAAWWIMRDEEKLAYDEGDVETALWWGELQADIMDDAVEMIRDPDHPAWELPRDENYQKGT